MIGEAGQERPKPPRTIGVFIMTEGPLAPDGGYRQCRVQVTGSGKIILAPLGGDCWGAVIHTVTERQLACLFDTFYAEEVPAEAVG